MLFALVEIQSHRNPNTFCWLLTPLNPADHYLCSLLCRLNQLTRLHLQAMPVEHLVTNRSSKDSSCSAECLPAVLPAAPAWCAALVRLALVDCGLVEVPQLVTSGAFKVGATCIPDAATYHYKIQTEMI